MRTRIGVIGAGSVGCYVGGSLAARGADVVLIGRERLRAEIETHGLTVTDVNGRSVVARNVEYTTDPSALAGCGVVLCAVKSAQTRGAAEQIASHAPRDAIVVSLQNGVGNTKTLRAHAPQSVLGGIVGFNVLSKGAGIFRQATSGELVIEDDPRIAALAHSLGDAGFDVRLARPIEPLQWAKLVMNLNNAVSALSGAPTMQIVFEPGYRRTLAAIVDEALGVLRRAGIRPAKLGAIPVTWFPFVMRLPSVLLRTLSRIQIQIDPEARSSMWEDLSLRRETEVEFLNGEIVRLATERGMDAPLNRRIVRLVHEAERAGAGSPQMSADALWSALQRD